MRHTDTHIYQRAMELNIESSELELLVSKAQQYRHSLTSVEEARSLLVSEDQELRQLAQRTKCHGAAGYRFVFRTIS